MTLKARGAPRSSPRRDGVQLSDAADAWKSAADFLDGGPAGRMFARHADGEETDGLAKRFITCSAAVVKKTIT